MFNTTEILVVSRFYPVGTILAITGYWKREGKFPKSEYFEKETKTATKAEFINALQQIYQQGATRATLRVRNKVNDLEYPEFHIDRMLPPEMLNPSPTEELLQLINLGQQMRTAQREYFRLRKLKMDAADQMKLAKQLEQAFDLKITELQEPPREPDNQTKLF